MSYNISLTSGTNLVTILDGTADTTYSSLTLFGQNYAGYGPLLNENMIYSLENFSNLTPPRSPLQGQLWWDSANQIMKVYNGSQWRVVSGPTSSTTPPTANVAGSLWWDSANQQLNSYTGAGWKLIGPAYTATQGVSGEIVMQVSDSLGGQHTVVAHYLAGVVVAISSNDLTFSSSIPGFTVVKPGYNILSSTQFNGNASNALNLGGVSAGNFLRSDVASTTNYGLTVLSNTGLTVGLNQDLTINVVGTNVHLSNNTTGKDITVSTTVSGFSTPTLTASGTTGRVSVYVDPVDNLNVATKHYVDSSITTAGVSYLKSDGSTAIAGNLAPISTGVYNLGSASTRFNTVYADTINGLNAYVIGADLAEYYVADALYSPGTVLDFGGSAEVCLTRIDMSTRVAGVVTTNPGYLMNAECSGEFVAALALQGRTPVRVLGAIAKGDCLVSAGNGFARAENNPKPGTIIGKALEDFGGIEGTIEVAVGRG